MADLILGSTTAMTESGGTVTIDSATVVPAAGITGTIGSGVIIPASQGGSMVKLASASVSTSVTYVDIEGLFDDSIYHEYFWSINDFAINPWATGGHPRFEFLTSVNTTYSSSNYHWIHGTHYANASGSTSQVQTRGGRSESMFEEMDGTWTWVNDYPSYWHIWIVNPTVAKKTMMRYNWGVNMTGTDYMLTGHGNVTIDNTVAISGARMQFADTTCGKHQYVLYGMKK
jgi:hypothetical protein